EFEDAECRVAPAQNVVYARRVPAVLAKFERVAMLSGKHGNKLFQPFGIHRPMRWQLEEYRTKLLAQCFGGREKVLERISRILQLLHVRDETRSLHRETKIFGRCLAPGGKCLCLRKPVKTIVDFNCVEVANV